MVRFFIAHSRFVIVSRYIIAATIVFSSIAFASPASAQYKPGNDPANPEYSPPPFRARVTDDELGHLTRLLYLDADQQTLMRTMFDGLDPVIQYGNSTAIKQQLFLRQALRGDARGTLILMRRMAQSNVNWRNERNTLEKQFFDGVKSLLSDEQVANWSGYDRSRRRRWELSDRAQMAGEGVDLILLCAQLLAPHPDQSEAIAPLLEQYAIELDRLIKERGTNLDQVEQQIADGKAGESSAIGPFLRAAALSRLAIVELNTSSIEALGQPLDIALRVQLRESFRAVSFPELSAPTQYEALADAILALDGLSDSQQLQVTADRDSFIAELHSMTGTLIALHLKEQRLAAQSIHEKDTQSGALLEAIHGREVEESGRRHDWINMGCQRLLSFLTEDQRAMFDDWVSAETAPSNVEHLIDEALGLLSGLETMPNGMDRDAFLALIQHAFEGIQITGVSIAMPTADGGPSAPAAVSVSDSDGMTTTIPVDLEIDNPEDDSKEDGG